jgi:ABC-type transporter Mla subunit MlaD
MSDEQPPRTYDDVMLPEPLRYLYEMVKHQAERAAAFEGETQRKFDFILEQQAQLTITVGRLAEKVDRTAGSITNLLAVAEIQADEIRELGESVRSLDERGREADERGRRTDERLDALISTVERYISEGRNGKDGG